MKLLVRSGLRFHLRGRAQLVLCLGGVALGVAVVVAMQLAIESARRAFDLSDEAVFGHVSDTLIGGPAGIPESLYVALRRDHREIPAAPVVEGRVYVPALERSMTVLGVDPFAEPALRGRDRVPAGRALERLLTEPGTVLASPDTARRLALSPGDRLRVLVAGEPRDLTLLQVLEPDDEVERAGLADVLVADLATAQEVLGRVGVLDRIDLALPPGVHAARATVARLLPASVRMEPAAARAGARREMTRAFYLNLRMMSLLALVVGLFLVYNAMTFAVVRRRTLMGTLRAVGVTAREILLMVLAEAAIVGAVATALGLPIGLWLARHLVVLVTRTIDDLYFAASVREVVLSPVDLGVPVMLGIAGAMLAALAPALEATRIPPRAAMSVSHLERRARAAVPLLAGAAVCAAVLAAVLLGGARHSLGAAFAALFALVAAATLLAPAATVAVSLGLERLAPRGAVSIVAMALRGLRRSLGRGSVAVAALMVALATTVGVAVMVSSFRDSLVDWLRTTLAADVYVRAPGGDVLASLPESLPRAVAALPGVQTVSVSRDVEVGTGYGTVWLKAVSLGPGRYRRLQVLDTDEETAWRALARGGTVLVSEPFAWRHGIARGQSLPVHTALGERRLTVAGVFRDYGSDRGMLLMGLPEYRRLFRDDGLNGLGLRVAPGAEPRQVAQEVMRLAGPSRQLQVRTQSDIRKASLIIFDRTFAITRVLQWLATGVACVGVLGALMALALERAREMAVLRALGMTRRELLVMLQVQTAGMGLAAGLMSLPLGVLMAAVLVHVVNRRAFGWSMAFHLPPGVLVEALALALLAALAAGLYPAWRMARTPPALALRET